MGFVKALFCFNHIHRVDQVVSSAEAFKFSWIDDFSTKSVNWYQPKFNQIISLIDLQWSFYISSKNMSKFLFCGILSFQDIGIKVFKSSDEAWTHRVRAFGMQLLNFFVKAFGFDNLIQLFVVFLSNSRSIEFKPSGAWWNQVEAKNKFIQNVEYQSPMITPKLSEREVRTMDTHQSRGSVNIV